MQTLTVLDLRGCTIGVSGAKYLADALQTNNVSYAFILWTAFVSGAKYRRSLLWISNVAKYKMVEHNILQMRFKTTMWTIYTNVHIVADLLKKSSVSVKLFYLTNTHFCIFHLCLDNYNADPWAKSNRKLWSSSSFSCITRQ